MNFLKNILNRDEASTSSWLPMSLPIPESVLNAAVEKALSTEAASEQRLKQLVVRVQEGCMNLDATAATPIGMVNFEACFEIETFELSNRKQEVVLKRRGSVETRADGFIRRAALYVVEAILATLFGKNVLDLGLKGQEGVKVEGDRIVIDLSKMGLQEKLIEAVKNQASNRLGVVGKIPESLAEKIFSVVSEKISSRIELTSVRCEDRKILLSVDKAI